MIGDAVGDVLVVGAVTVFTDDTESSIDVDIVDGATNGITEGVCCDSNSFADCSSDETCLMH